MNLVMVMGLTATHGPVGLAGDSFLALLFFVAGLLSLSAAAFLVRRDGRVFTLSGER